MALPGVIAVKASQRASESMTSALKNDLYVHKWTSTKGKGKKKREVEHELHINPVSVGVGLIGGVIGASVAAWVAGKAVKGMGYRLKGGNKTMVRVLRIYDAMPTIVHHAETGHYIYATHKGRGYGGPKTWIVDTAAWDETTFSGGRAIIFTKRGVPIREWKPPVGSDVPLEWPQTLTARQMSEGWTWQGTMAKTSGKDRYGAFKQAAYRLVNPNLKSIISEDVSEKSDGKGGQIMNMLFNPLWWTGVKLP